MANKRREHISIQLESGRKALDELGRILSSLREAVTASGILDDPFFSERLSKANKLVNIVTEGIGNLEYEIVLERRAAKKNQMWDEKIRAEQEAREAFLEQQADFANQHEKELGPLYGEGPF